MTITSSRTGGILLHPTSLPGRHGIGELGAQALRFADITARMGLRWWQMLPVGPTGYGDSPYQSPSTFAGNPMLIDLDALVSDGLLTAREAGDHPPFPEDFVEFGQVIPAKMRILALAASRLSGSSELATGLDEFRERHSAQWLDEFALFTALKRANELRPWWDWDEELAIRRSAALRRARRTLAAPIHQITIEQFLFDRQFRVLRERCAELGIGLIGDLPIFVAHDSADVWSNRHLFHLDAAGRPTVVAGVPPDYFSETGQRWGNPLYVWKRHRADGFAWWTERMRRMFELFDLVRIDHFRGFMASWHIPASEPTAVEGEWVPAPGIELFDHLRSAFPRLPVIAEDLGVITEDVEALRDRYGFPGMKVLQFGFGAESDHSLDEFRPNVIAYTGTHDNDTTLGWLASDDPARDEEQRAALDYFDTEGDEFNWDMIGAVFGSVANTAIVPLQDVLGLGSEARMNVPGRDAGNWRWRFRWDQLTDEIIERMRTLVIESRRQESAKHPAGHSDRA